MRIILLILFAAGFYSCVGSNVEPKEYTENPCQDVLYQKLKKIKESEMTGSEREYFKMKDKECEEFSDYRKELKRDEKLATMNLIFILGTVVFITILGLILFSGGSWH